MKKLIILLFAFFNLAIVSADYDDCGMMPGFYVGNIGMTILIWILSLLVIALIIATIYWLIKSATKKK